MFDLYRNNIVKTLTDSRINDLSRELNDGSIYELEAKFTSYSYEKNSYISSVPHVHYTRLIDILNKDLNYTKKIEKSDVILYENNIRKITIDEIGGQEIIYQRKTIIKNIDIDEYNIRISLNNEILFDIKNAKPKGITRGRIRNSYSSKSSPIRIDITEITEETTKMVINESTGKQEEKKKIFIKYEVEIEYYGMKSDIQVFFDEIEKIFKLMKGTKNIYTNETKKLLDNDISSLLKIKPITKSNYMVDETKYNKITSRTLVKARNIKYRDLVYGGIVGNKVETIKNKNVLIDKNNGTDYYITYKADGIRKYLIIHRTGIWLVYPNEEYNLLISSSDKQYTKIIDEFEGSVFDTELVILKNNEYDIEHFVLAFDCFSFKRITKENKTYSERLQYCKIISGSLNNSIITVELKDAYLIPKNPLLFFPLVKRLYKERKTLNWKDDGFIFTPNNVIYNPRSQTITFSVKNRNLYLLDRNKEIKFEGSDQNNIDYKDIEFSSEFGNLVEYSWNGKKLIPIKKSKSVKPDNKDYAMKIWDDITSSDIAPNKLLTNTPDVCKWKHPEDLTIDFQIKIISGENNSRILNLYVFDGQNPVKFTGTDRYPLLPENIRMKGSELTINESLNNKIIEFEWKKENDKVILQPRKYRNDKTNPNQKIVAEDVWEDIMDPIFIEDLVGDTPELAIKYHNTIKADLYYDVGKKYEKNFTLLDIGSGRGGDIGRWKKFTGNIIAVEPYKPNRDELIKRLEKSDVNDRVTIVPLGGEKTVEITKAVKENIPGGKVDVVSLMLSMSFFWSSTDHLEALVRTIVTNLKPGGKIIFLTIDGNSIEQLFEPVNGKKVNEMKIAGATIHLYPSLGPQWGRPVDFELPGSIIEEGGQREYIVHIDDFTKKLSDYGFVLEKISKAIKPNLLLSEQNLLYTSLYSYGSYINKNGNKLKEFNTNIKLPKIPEVIREIPLKQSNPLEPLEVIAVLKGPAINDDTYAPLKCTWFNGEVFRIATINEYNSILHATLKCFYEKYQNHNDYQFRLNLVYNIRRELSMILDYENPEYPNYSYWQTIGNGILPRMVMEQIVNPELIEATGYDYSIQGLIKLFNSNKILGNEIFKLISEIFKFNIYIVKVTKEDIEIVDRIYKFGRQNIIISGNEFHFEVITIDVDGEFQTIFDDNDEFIEALDSKYPENKLEDEIYDPSETFINDFIEIFTVNGIFKFPEEIYDIFPDPDDPFRRSLDLVYDNLIELTNY